MGNKGFLSFLFLGLLVAAPVFLLASPVMAQDCTNPNGDEGVLLYHQDYGAFMGCTADGWKAFHPATRTPPPPPPPTCPTSGLVAHWKFDEGSGTTANDSAGSNHGTLVGSPTWTTGKIGGALDFNGTTDSVTITSHTALNNLDSLSVCGWFSIRSAGSGWRVLISKGIETDEGWDLYGAHQAHYYGFDHRIGGHIEAIGSGTADWQHLCATAGDGFIRVYRNGILGASAVLSGSSFNDSAIPVTINGISGSGIYRWEGRADDVRIYDRALSAEEVAEIYNSGDGCP